MNLNDRVHNKAYKVCLCVFLFFTNLLYLQELKFGELIQNFYDKMNLIFIVNTFILHMFDIKPKCVVLELCLKLQLSKAHSKTFPELLS